MSGTSKESFTFVNISKPLSMPGPLYESNELLFALSNDPLKTQGILSCSVVALNFSATLIAKSSDSRTFTPPIMHKG